MGDSNSSYVHTMFKVQRNRNEVVRDMDNIEHEGLVVPNAFAKHYKLFMGVECTSTPLNERDTFTSQLHTDVRNHMVRLVTNDEIKKTMFSIGDNSAPVFTEALGEFKEASGMIPGIHKSMAYFYNLVNHVEMWILSLMPFEEGTLPVNYLGVPLISSSLLYKDSKVLVD
ncbi:hypothetical protein Tco_0474922 [Tanacetum coccineum]